MQPTLHEIARSQSLELQIVATGMHLDRTRGYTLAEICRAGFEADATIPWKQGDYSPSATACATGRAIAGLTRVYEKLAPDIVLVVGDRVEAFAAASAAHLCGLVVAHIHGGDRALGQVDDSLRHAITKLSHLHFPATAQSARRIVKLGEDRRYIFRVGSPALDGIHQQAASPDATAHHLRAYGSFQSGEPYTLLVLHPESPDGRLEYRHASMLLKTVFAASTAHTVIIYPNTDPGSDGIVRAWQGAQSRRRATFVPSVPRDIYLGLLREATVLVGNSSSGIIEAASFGTPVLDIGQRQAGREHSKNLVHASWDAHIIRAELVRIWNGGHPARSTSHNVYGSGAAKKIIRVLQSVALDDSLRRKLIAY